MSHSDNIIRVGCVVILNKDDKILCVTRRHQQVHGLPGGKIDPQEDIAVGASRELYEETNLKVNPEHLEKIYEEYEEENGLRKYFTSTFYVHYKNVLNISELKQMEDGIIPKWLTWDEFQSNDAFPVYDEQVKIALSKYLMEHHF